MIVQTTVCNGKLKAARHTYIELGKDASLGWRKSLAINVWNRPDTGHLAEPNKIQTHEFMVFGDKAHRIHKLVVHRFRMGDVEDPDLYAAQPLLDWQHSEMGVWVMERAVDTPEWHRMADTMNYGYQYAIVAKLKDIDYTWWTLKWGNTVIDI